MAEAAPKAYKGKDGQVYQLFFHDKHQREDDDEEVEVDQNELHALTTSSVDPYSDLNIHPPQAAPNRTNPFRPRTQVAGRVREKATVVNKVAGSDDVVLFEKKKLGNEDSTDDETEMDTLLRGMPGSSASAITQSLESIDIDIGSSSALYNPGGSFSSSNNRFLIKTDSDLDLLVYRPSTFEEVRARGRWFCASLQKCPSMKSYARVLAVVVGVFLLYLAMVVVILELLGTG